MSDQDAEELIGKLSATPPPAYQARSKTHKKILTIRMTDLLHERMTAFIESSGVYYSINQFVNEAIWQAIRSPKAQNLIQAHLKREKESRGE